MGKSHSHRLGEVNLMSKFRIDCLVIYGIGKWLKVLLNDVNKLTNFHIKYIDELQQKDQGNQFTSYPLVI